MNVNFFEFRLFCPWLRFSDPGVNQEFKKKKSGERDSEEAESWARLWDSETDSAGDEEGASLFDGSGWHNVLLLFLRPPILLSYSSLRSVCG